MHSFINLPTSFLDGAHILLWVCAALVAYTYIGYSLLLRVLLLFIHRKPIESCDDKTITLLISAHNEAAHIEEKINECLALNYPSDRMQLLIVSDGSTDGTDEIVRTFADRGVELIRIAIQSGKTHAQNVGVEKSRGEILIFSDATTHYHRDALRYLAGNYNDVEVGAVSGAYFYQDPTGVSPNGAGASAYAKYDNQLRDLESRVWSISGCCGCIYSVRRSLYTALAPEVISDLVQPLHVLQQGFRVTYEPRALAWELTTASPRREFSMRVRVVARALAGLMSVPELLMPWRSPWTSLQLWSHKLLRWSVPLFLVGILTCSVALCGQLFYRLVFCAQLIVYGMAAFTYVLPIHRKWRLLGIPLYFCIVNLAAVGGFVQYARGQRYAAWKPERESA